MQMVADCLIRDGVVLLILLYPGFCNIMLPFTVLFDRISNCLSKKLILHTIGDATDKTQPVYYGD